ncbi:uncharacterized protein LOC121858770 [Homarus americanus]|uniref:uncharacterized protein LOC121858770 n=1 Tax=Homarus americanus TaxID=6706 RepID=UPI001C452F74|nr:uncharacterized protein LOC121858770 [Homarus americanus]
MMANLSRTLEKIKNGKLVDIQGDVERIVELGGKDGTEGQQMVRRCSRYAFENQNLERPVFSAMMDIIDLVIKHQHVRLATEPLFHLNSIFYIITLAARRKDLHQYLTGLMAGLEPYVSQCDATKGDVQDMLKALSQCVWEASLANASPQQTLILQRFSLQYLTAAGTSVVDVCQKVTRVHQTFTRAQKSEENLDKFYEFAINMLTTGRVETEKTYDGEDVLAVFGLVMEYAKIVDKLDKFASFSKITRPFVTFFESICEEQIILALKVGLKLVEVGMALKAGKCKEEMIVKLVMSCSFVSNILEPNTIVLVSLLYTTELFEYEGNEDALHSLSSETLALLVKTLLARCIPPLPEDIIRKVVTVLHLQLGYFVEQVSTSTDQNKTLTQALHWVTKANSFIATYCTDTAHALTGIYNVGVNSGNLGVLAFRNNRYDMAAKILEMYVDMLYRYHTAASQEMKNLVGPSISKKIRLWSDSLRYNEQCWEAGVAAARGHLMGFLSREDLFTMWIKCKRDVVKYKNKTLKGLTVCDVVSEAQKKYGKAEGVSINEDELLLTEIKYYMKQDNDTFMDRLSCGRKLVECGNSVKIKVRGLLAVSEALWHCPKLATLQQEALNSANTAINMLKEASCGGECDPSLQELKAMAYFWVYLCQLQEMSDIVAEQVKDLEKPVSLTAQATDLGEEVQENDECHVRPAAASLTLHDQDVSLTPLHTALKIWEELSSQDVTLGDVEMTCECLTSAGYVYQLCGVVAPTVRAWVSLVSIARRYSLHTFLIKGINELLLVVPELVPVELVKEVEAAVASYQEANAQDSSLIYLNITTTAAIAYYHFKMGQYKEGGEYISRALKTKVMEKQTIGATEVQTLVHLVASLYASLPPWLLQPDHRPSEPCAFLALMACRQSIALMKTNTSSINNELICWRHKLAWLHIITTTWMGHLFINSVQPRPARAYLKESFRIAQKMALPLRTAELLELLAWVDLQCDQVDDCLFKIDILKSILVVHSPCDQTVATIVPEFSKLTISHNKSKSKKVRQQPHHQKTGRVVFEESEKMRAASRLPEFKLRKITGNPAVVKIGSQNQLVHFGNQEQPTSPITDHLKKTTVLQFEPCPRRTSECDTCATPAVQYLCISTNVLLGRIHSLQGQSGVAHKCFNMAKELYNDVLEKGPEISSHLAALIDKKQIGKLTSSSSFILSRLNLVRLQTLHGIVECLALRKEYEEALSVNLQALHTVSQLDRRQMFESQQFIIQLILQGQALERILKQVDAGDSSGEVCEQSPNKQEEKYNSGWVTPLKTKAEVETSSCIKSSRQYLGVPKPGRCHEKSFCIYSDDDLQDQTSTKKMPPTRPKKKIPMTSMKTLAVETKATGASSRKKKNVVKKISCLNETDSDECTTKLALNMPDFSPLSPANRDTNPSIKEAESVISDRCLSLTGKSITKKKVGHKTKEPSCVMEVIDVSDTESCPNDNSNGSDDMEVCYESENKVFLNKGRASAKDEKQTKEPKSKTKTTTGVKPTSSRQPSSARTRTTRSLRLI